jgi:hypothetical protein
MGNTYVLSYEMCVLQTLFHCIMCIDFFFGNIHDCTPLNYRIQVLSEGGS